MANKKKSAAQKQRARTRQQQRAAVGDSTSPAPAGDASSAASTTRAPKGQASRPRGPSRRTPMWVFVAGVVAAVALMAILFATRKSPTSGGAGGSQTGIDKATSVSAATFEKIGVPSDAPPIPKLPTGTPAVVTDGKPVMTYIGAEFCPYCAAERWPVVVALSRFGTFTDLGITTSAPKPEIYPDTPTFSFHGSSFASDYLVFSSVETATNQPDPNGGWTTLDTPTAQQQQLFDTYNTKEITGSTGGIPFIMVGNLYAWAGATYDPGVLEGLSFDEIASRLDNPDSKVAQGVDGAANQITAMICQLTGDQPSEVCSAQYIQQAQAALQGS